jgi:hypothetical protein
MRWSQNCDSKTRVSELNVPEHVRHDEESHVASANVDLVEMGDTAIAGSDGDVLELNVHVVLGCEENQSQYQTAQKKHTPKLVDRPGP